MEEVEEVKESEMKMFSLIVQRLAICTTISMPCAVLSMQDKNQIGRVTAFKIS